MGYTHRVLDQAGIQNRPHSASISLDVDRLICYNHPLWHHGAHQQWKTSIGKRRQQAAYGIRFEYRKHHRQNDAPVSSSCLAIFLWPIPSPQLFSYPAVYVVCVLPLTIVRWVDLNDDNISAAAIIVTSIIYSLSGFFNVLLFKFTRPTLIQDDIDNIDGSSQHELPTSASGYSGVPTGAGGTTYKPTGLARPVVASPGPEASAAKYARTHAGSQATSSHDQEHRHH